MEEEKKKPSASQIVKEIKRRTRRKFTAEEKIKIVLEDLRGEETVAAICRKYDIHQNNYFKWSKEFIEAGIQSQQWYLEIYLNSNEPTKLLGFMLKSV
jgi:transposase